MLTLILLHPEDDTARPTTFRLRGDAPAVVGRRNADVQLADSRVSKRHAEIKLKQGTWIIRDLGSANGTWVNGDRITGLCELEEGDRLRLGRLRLVVGHVDTVAAQDTALDLPPADHEAPAPPADAVSASSAFPIPDPLDPPAAIAENADDADESGFIDTLEPSSSESSGLELAPADDDAADALGLPSVHDAGDAIELELEDTPELKLEAAAEPLSELAPPPSPDASAEDEPGVSPLESDDDIESDDVISPSAAMPKEPDPESEPSDEYAAAGDAFLPDLAAPPKKTPTSAEEPEPAADDPTPNASGTDQVDPSDDDGGEDHGRDADLIEDEPASPEHLEPAVVRAESPGPRPPAPPPAPADLEEELDFDEVDDDISWLQSDAKPEAAGPEDVENAPSDPGAPLIPGPVEIEEDDAVAETETAAERNDQAHPPAEHRVDGKPEAEPDSEIEAVPAADARPGPEPEPELGPNLDPDLEQILLSGSSLGHLLDPVDESADRDANHRDAAASAQASPQRDASPTGREPDATDADAMAEPPRSPRNAEAQRSAAARPGRATPPPGDRRQDRPAADTKKTPAEPEDTGPIREPVAAASDDQELVTPHAQAQLSVRRPAWTRWFKSAAALLLLGAVAGGAWAIFDQMTAPSSVAGRNAARSIAEPGNSASQPPATLPSSTLPGVAPAPVTPPPTPSGSGTRNQAEPSPSDTPAARDSSTTQAPRAGDALPGITEPAEPDTAPGVSGSPLTGGPMLAMPEVPGLPAPPRRDDADAESRRGSLRQPPPVGRPVPPPAIDRQPATPDPATPAEMPNPESEPETPAAPPPPSSEAVPSATTVPPPAPDTPTTADFPQNNNDLSSTRVTEAVAQPGTAEPSTPDTAAPTADPESLANRDVVPDPPGETTARRPETTTARPTLPTDTSASPPAAAGDIADADEAVAPSTTVAPAAAEPTPRTVYLVDASGSMVDSMNQGVLTWLQQQLGALPPGQEFAVLFFRNGEIFAPPTDAAADADRGTRGDDAGPVGGYVAARGAAADRAAAWIQPRAGHVQPYGRSQPGPAWARVRELAPDRLYILSDDKFGDAGPGRDTLSNAAIRAALPEGLVIHTVQFFYRSPEDRRLAELAEQSGGTYQFVAEPITNPGPGLEFLTP